MAGGNDESRGKGTALTASRRIRRVLFLAVLISAAVLVGVLSILPRLRARDALTRQTDALAAPVVQVVHPSLGDSAQEVILPGNIQAYSDAPIYARTSGYLRKWFFDLGAHVRRGQVLAEIESPEIDKQLQQGREDLDTAQANLKLAQITAGRYSDLFKTDSVARQDVDNAVQDAAAKAAAVKSAQANVGRLQELVGFERIEAPFDGVITARNTDVGQLIEGGPSAATSKELFHVAAIDRLRVFVNVPQIYSHEASTGSAADLTLPEMPKRRFPGKLIRSAHAFDPATRTLLVEVDVPNREGFLFPGAYVQVHLKIETSERALLVPPTSLLFRSEGLRAATVVNDRAVLVPVTLGRDMGNAVEVLTGITASTQIIVNPPDSLVNGEQVRTSDHAAAARPGE